MPKRIMEMIFGDCLRNDWYKKLSYLSKTRKFPKNLFV